MAPPPDSSLFNLHWLGLPMVKSGKPLEKQHFPKLTRFSHPDDLKGLGFKMHPVSNEQFHPGFLTGINHLLCIRSIYRHGLFTNYMFARFSHPDHLVSMQCIWRNNIYSIYIRVIPDLIKILVVIAILIRYLIFRLPVFYFRRCTAYHPNKFCFFTGFHRFCNTGTITAQVP